MVLFQVGVTAATTVVAVLVGGWLTLRSQDRLWRRDQSRQWRDIRLSAYTEFTDAFREYMAYVLNPDSLIKAVPRPRPPHDLMPFFDESGTRYKEQLESTKTGLRLVAGNKAVVTTSSALVRRARELAALRATMGVDELPGTQFDALWAAEDEFIEVARAELGLTDQIPLRHAEQTHPGERG
jgi:hypothetical protein